MDRCNFRTDAVAVVITLGFGHGQKKIYIQFVFALNSSMVLSFHLSCRLESVMNVILRSLRYLFIFQCNLCVWYSH